MMAADALKMTLEQRELAVAHVQVSEEMMMGERL